MDIQVMKVGVVSCSGEEIPEGTLCRLACRKVLDERPGETVTICLPLFIAGGEEERTFAHNYPTITVDGCDKTLRRQGHGDAVGQTQQIAVHPRDSQEARPDAPDQAAPFRAGGGSRGQGRGRGNRPGGGRGAGGRIAVDNGHPDACQGDGAAGRLHLKRLPRRGARRTAQGERGAGRDLPP